MVTIKHMRVSDVKEREIQSGETDIVCDESDGCENNG
jgi:hypothetical protein